MKGGALTIRVTPTMNVEFRPVWIRRQRPPYWMKMYPCRCFHGLHPCGHFTVRYYGYLCRMCSVHVPGEFLPRCICRCVGCTIPAVHDPDVNWFIQRRDEGEEEQAMILRAGDWM